MSSCSSSPSGANVDDLGDRSKVTPQQVIDKFWKQFTTKKPGKATTVVPSNTYTEFAAKRGNQVTTTTCQASYDDAAATCRAKVEKIVKECRRVNKRYRDPHFDIEVDLKWRQNDCLRSLSNREDEVPGIDLAPESVKRVGEIFDNPRFYIDGPTANDIRQGRNGDCWFIAALCTLSEKPGVIERLCVAHDTDVGVYGFVFYRDGEWISEIVDDFLYLIKPDYDEGYLDRVLFDDIERVDPDEAYRRIFQSNSGALYFAQCAHPQETWLPLLEKCYAKAHGDYCSIEGGHEGEGLEDLTGGITSELVTTDILDREYFWKEQLLKVNDEFLFGCSTGVFGGWGERKGIVEGHAYSIQKAVEIDGKRLLKVKNPWGKHEWTGPWSDGSKEWTAEWLQKLDHRFGDDGDFWISYEDLLRKYQTFSRTRLFTPEWRVTQLWTTFAVPWVLDYHDSHFSFTLSNSGPVVIALSQLDDRFFRGLEGQYRFELNFRLHKAGHSDYVIRSQAPFCMTRSVNVELELEAGDYEVRVKINATRDLDILPIEKVIKNNAKSRREKLLRIGLAYDLGHCKGRFVETPEEKKARQAHEKQIKQKRREKIKAKLLKERENSHYILKQEFQRSEHRRLKNKQKRKLKEAALKAKRDARLAEKKALKAEKAKEKALKAEDKAKAKAEAMAKANAEAEVEAKEKAESEAKAQTDQKAEEPAENSETDAVKPEEPMTPESDNSDEKDIAKEKPAEEKPTEEETSTEPAAEEAEASNSDSESSSSSESDTEEEVETDVESVGTLLDLADREIWIHVDNFNGEVPASDSDSDSSSDSGSEAGDDVEKDPWNAVVVVGIRIFHKGLGEGEEDGDLNLKVIRPIPFGKDNEEVDVGKKCSTKVLDVDDSAKDATLVGDTAEKIRFIKGDSARRRTVTSMF
ncbi:hypothetical protein LB507_009508 [Fusarium sp. FIESC RH6]|nr:hypothetical protein LB507_009508 [Fusarium sp. FIESC RH6]